jgi:hypothetical protein
LAEAWPLGTAAASRSILEAEGFLDELLDDIGDDLVRAWRGQA